MLVDVVRLRHEGKKLPKEAVLAAAPLRGYLRIYSWRLATSEATTLVWSASISSYDEIPYTPALPCLESARVTRIQGNDMIIVGKERPGYLDAGPTYPQAWWCRLVRDGATDSPPPPPSTP